MVPPPLLVLYHKTTPEKLNEIRDYILSNLNDPERPDDTRFAAMAEQVLEWTKTLEALYYWIGIIHGKALAGHWSNLAKDLKDLRSLSFTDTLKGLTGPVRRRLPKEY